MGRTKPGTKARQQEEKRRAKAETETNHPGANIDADGVDAGVGSNRPNSNLNTNYLEDSNKAQRGEPHESTGIKEIVHTEAAKTRDDIVEPHEVNGGRGSASITDIQQVEVKAKSKTADEMTETLTKSQATKTKPIKKTNKPHTRNEGKRLNADKSNCDTKIHTSSARKHEVAPKTEAAQGTITKSKSSGPCTEEEKENHYSAFCELESDPSILNVILKDFGVSGIKVHQLIALDYAATWDQNMIERPVYGLIFLYKYTDLSNGNQSRTCPNHVWFANQTQANLCCTLALFNIINNIPGADLGPHLQSFKDFTRSFAPPLRGDALANFQYVKDINNSFARKMDMLQADVEFHCKVRRPLPEQVKKRKPSSNESSKPIKKQKVVKQKSLGLLEGGANHYVAFVPINGEIWKLDGMELEPEMVGTYDDSKEEWLQIALPYIQSCLLRFHADQAEFSVLALASDPIIEQRGSVIENIKELQVINERLIELEIDWKLCQSGADKVRLEKALLGPNKSLGISQQGLDEWTVDASFSTNLDTHSQPELLQERSRLLEKQENLRKDLEVAVKLAEDEQENANQFRFDYEPMLEAWLGMLARKDGVLEGIWNELGF